jgi:hypothetical protein
MLRRRSKASKRSRFYSSRLTTVIEAGFLATGCQIGLPVACDVFRLDGEQFRIWVLGLADGKSEAPLPAESHAVGISTPSIRRASTVALTSLCANKDLKIANAGLLCDDCIPSSDRFLHARQFESTICR